MANNVRRKVLSDLKGIQKTSTDVRLIAKKFETLIRNGKIEPTTNTMNLVGRARKPIIRAQEQLAKEITRLLVRARK